MREPVKAFTTGHEELIHDIEYDFYGKQLATCSSDQHIKVFDFDPSTSTWILNDSWKAHDSSVVKLAYASPEFGHILASISYDRTIKIWEQDLDEEAGSGKRWKRLATIADSHGPLYDLAFAPSHLGLRLGAIGSDGVLRIYDAVEPADLSNWTLTNEISVLATPPASRLQSDFALTWSPSRFSNEYLVVCALDQGFIYQKGDHDKYVLASVLPEHHGLIRSVSWAPSMGRSFQLIATGCKDGNVRIFKLRTEPAVSNGADMITDGVDEFVENKDTHIELLSSHDDHKSEVWKVSWNTTGTMLSSSGGDCKIRLWKATYSDEFQCMSIISAEKP
ncbi:hypothetical protein LJB42_000227 [Komagataella kurtzmanii]|nr:hypothetical protein LJB42_000227 [Komagataella kurtzmanii]